MGPQGHLETSQMYRFSKSILVPWTRDGLQPLHLDEFFRWFWADRSLSIISMIHCSCDTSSFPSSITARTSLIGFLDPNGKQNLKPSKTDPNKDPGEVGLRWLDAESECLALTPDCSVGWPLSPPCLVTLDELTRPSYGIHTAMWAIGVL